MQLPKKAAAWLEGECEVGVDDLQILRYVWWSTPADREAVIALLIEHPALMTRPIFVAGDRAIVGRPSERVLELLG